MSYFSITELPDYQHRMSLHKEVIQQCFLVGLSSMSDCWTSTTIIGFLLCLSRCQKAHENLLQPYVVEGVIRICEMRRKHNVLMLKGDNSPELQVLKYAKISLNSGYSNIVGRSKDN